MDYGKLLRRAWDIVWNNKWLILLGILVALGSGSPSTPGGGDSGYRFDADEFRDFDREFDFDPERDFGPDFRGDAFDPRSFLPALGIGLAIAVPLIILAVVIGVALWVISTLARGGLIDAVNAIETGGTSGFGMALSAGWQRGWPLVGISLLPAIPIIVLLVTGAGLGGAFYGLSSLPGGESFSPAFAGLGATLGIIACVAGLASLVLNLLRTFAERACMLEGKGVFESYGRGWQVLKENLGPAFIIFLIQVVLSLAAGLALLIASPILCLMCLIIIPVVLIVEGGIASYFSTLWTLAWREWTEPTPRGEPIAEVSPLV